MSIAITAGSHGGARAESQKEFLAGYGITEEAMGCPVRSSMETVLLGYSEYGKPVYQDKNANSADGIIVSCRIKPHNAFRGSYESGVCKMMVVVEKSNIQFAIPCIENAYDETALIEAIQACIRTANQIDREHVRMVRIKNTLHVGEIMLSESYYEDVKFRFFGVQKGTTTANLPRLMEDWLLLFIHGLN